MEGYPIQCYEEKCFAMSWQPGLEHSATMSAVWFANKRLIWNDSLNSRDSRHCQSVYNKLVTTPQKLFHNPQYYKKKTKTKTCGSVGAALVKLDTFQTPVCQIFMTYLEHRLQRFSHKHLISLWRTFSRRWHVCVWIDTHPQKWRRPRWALIFFSLSRSSLSLLSRPLARTLKKTKTVMTLQLHLLHRTSIHLLL